MAALTLTKVVRSCYFASGPMVDLKNAIVPSLRAGGNPQHSTASRWIVVAQRIAA